MRCLPLLVSTLLVGTLLTPSLALARGGGGGGGGGFHGGGGDRGGGAWGGGDYHFQNDNWQHGYNGYHPMYGEGARPGWNGNNDSFNRNVTVNNNFYNRDYNGWNSNWRNGGYWNNRAWNHVGWYNGWGGWGWWGGNAAVWGIAGLATGAAITSLVNNAADNNSTIITVPDTSYQLNYGSVESVGTYGASFSYDVDGSTLMGAANCQQGLLNGQVPGTSDQAQLLNAVCQVAYGAGN